MFIAKRQEVVTRVSYAKQEKQQPLNSQSKTHTSCPSGEKIKE